MMLPSPKSHAQWESWASALLKALSERQLFPTTWSKTISLGADATETVLTDQAFTGMAALLLVPQSAAAAAALPSIWQTPIPGQITLHHASNPATDQHFRAILL